MVSDAVFTEYRLRTPEVVSMLFATKDRNSDRIAMTAAAGWPCVATDNRYQAGTGMVNELLPCSKSH